MQYTFSMIKPDATQRNLTNEINQMLKNYGLEIVKSKEMTFSVELAQQFYKEHAHRSFFGELLSDITSGPVVVQILKGDNAVLKNRTIMGATNPKDAENFTIRHKYGLSIGHNSIHGSDSEENATREINLIFPGFLN